MLLAIQGQSLLADFVVFAAFCALLVVLRQKFRKPPEQPS